MALLEDFQWRYATKAYDPTKKVAQQDLDKIIEAARLAPTSSGLQPFRIIAIEDKAIREQLLPGSLNPDCLKDCSHILVFAAWDEYTEKRVDDMFDFTVKERNIPYAMVEAYVTQLKAFFAQQTKEEHQHHAAKQAYIALGFALAQAAELKIDTTPAEGINANVFDQVLNLKEQGLKTAFIVYVGYSDKQRDWLAPMKKVRIPTDEFVTFI